MTVSNNNNRYFYPLALIHEEDLKNITDITNPNLNINLPSWMLPNLLASTSTAHTAFYQQDLCYLSSPTTHETHVIHI